MIIMKFGGTSIADAERIHNVCSIIKQNLDKEPIVIVSAVATVTDRLIQIAQDALKNNANISLIKKIHQNIAKELNISIEPLEPLFNELSILLKGIYMVKELTPRTLDYVVSFGERLSVRLISNYLNVQGIKSIAVDAFDLGLVTDSNFGNATPLPESSYIIAWNIKRYKEYIPIITGYIAKDKKGNITTLGRNGSDYTAAIIGSALDAKEIQIWSNVDGVMTADPSILPNVKPIETMTFEEASEVAYYGGRLHPHTLLPAVQKEIPIRLLNTLKKDSHGTLILTTTDETTNLVKSIVYKENLFLINIISPGMLFRHGFMARIFNIFAKYKIVIDMIATSEISISMTTDSGKNLDKVADELKEFVEVNIERNKTIVCLVGEGIKKDNKIAGEVFKIMGDNNINIQMISQSAEKINLAFLIDNDDIEKTVTLLHKHFFEA